MATEVCPSNGPFSDLFTLQCRHATHVSRISRYISERNVSIDIVIYLPEKPFSSRLDFLVLITVTEKKKWQTCNRYSMGSWLRQVKSEDSVRGLPDQYNNHMEYSLFKVHLSRYLWSNKTAFFPHDKYFKAKISKSHIKTAYIVFLGRTKNFPHLKV